MDDSQNTKCHTIIHAAATAAAGAAAGLAQIPGSDNVVITPIQIGMIVSLGKVFGEELSEAAAMAALATAAATVVGRGLSQFLVGWIPGIGNIINASTAFGITESIGWYMADVFDEADKERGKKREELPPPIK
ncbi:MAG: hypothetical protein LBQ90_00470 [Synergistaceae bacterium]|jgi:uncharacterized protein (DUF697 family)|nr:hypothetical protein [Synergistaceae bacterium]